MATKLVAILLVLLVCRGLPDLARLRDFSWWRAWLDKLGTPSATTALRSDSIDASSAIVMAGPDSSRTSCSVTCGTWGAGNPPLTTPKRDPIVSTGSPAT